MVYVSPNRKIDRFDGKRESGLLIEDWIEDARAVIASRGLTSHEQAAFLIENLSGKARREILGRGKSISSDPSKIFAVLTKVFGDGDTLPQLQQRFFAYHQKDGEDLVACSLELVNLYDRIIQLDPSFKPGRETQLKNRLAEAVLDDNLRTELRRLNADQPALSFFDARDHVITLMGRTERRSRAKRGAVLCEVAAEEDLRALIIKQGEQVAAQQKQLELLTSMIQNRNTSTRTKPSKPTVSADGKRRCWKCDAIGHISRDCPKKRDRQNGSATETNGKAETDELN
ncbi:uncharacterized protein [Ptychodera flava]|uniref:uncharacterized protein n=1 Tax=Ptychodera flava TaxID=63121 RepID=UPI00396A1593